MLGWSNMPLWILPIQDSIVMGLPYPLLMNMVSVYLYLSFDPSLSPCPPFWVVSFATSTGKAHFLDSASRKLQNGSLRRRPQKQQPKDASGQLPAQAVDFLQCPDSLSCCDSNRHPRSPSSMNGLLRTFKVR